MPPKTKKTKDKEEEPPKATKVQVPDELIRSGLKEMALSLGSPRSPDRQSMGYTKLDLNGAFLPKPIDLVSSNFAAYKTLRSINLKKNSIVEFNQRSLPSAVASLPFLINLDLRQNQIASLASLNRKPAEGEETVYWPRLQHVYLGSNLIDKISPIGCPNLILLDVSGNKINQIQEGDDGFKGHDNLQVLDISNNLLTNLGSLNGLKKLARLYASGNRVFKFSGLEGCEELEFIHLRDNAVAATHAAHRLRVYAAAAEAQVPEPAEQLAVEVGRDRKDQSLPRPRDRGPILQPLHQRLQRQLRLPAGLQVQRTQAAQAPQQTPPHHGPPRPDLQVARRQLEGPRAERTR